MAFPFLSSKVGGFLCMNLGFSIKLSAVAFINPKRRASDDMNEVCCMLYLLYGSIGEAIVDYKNISNESNWLYSAPTAQIICLVLRSFSILT